MSEKGITNAGKTASYGPTEELRADDLEAVRKLKDAFTSIKTQLGRIIVGQEEVRKSRRKIYQNITE